MGDVAAHAHRGVVGQAQDELAGRACGDGRAGELHQGALERHIVHGTGVAAAVVPQCGLHIERDAREVALFVHHGCSASGRRTAEPVTPSTPISPSAARSSAWSTPSAMTCRPIAWPRSQMRTTKSRLSWLAARLPMKPASILM